MKSLLKWTFRLILLMIVTIVALVLSKDAILKALAERHIRAQTGMDVRIGRFAVSILSPVVTIEQFKLYNPPEFGGAPFLDVPELHLEYDRLALVRGELHVTLLRLNLAELNVVRNDAGHTNLVSLPAKGPQAGAARRAQVAFAGVDVMNLSLGRARYLDLKNPRNNREVTLNLQNQVFKNVRTIGDLYGVLAILWLRSGGGLVHDVSEPRPRMRTGFSCRVRAIRFQKFA